MRWISIKDMINTVTLAQAEVNRWLLTCAGMVIIYPVLNIEYRFLQFPFSARSGMSGIRNIYLATSMGTVVLC